MAENKCPFKLPVRKKVSIDELPYTNYVQLVDADGLFIHSKGNSNSDYVHGHIDYLVKALNCHEKLVGACKRGHCRLLEMGQKESHRTVHILKQALTEAKKCIDK